jgi:hypothetical protein
MLAIEAGVGLEWGGGRRGGGRGGGWEKASGGGNASQTQTMPTSESLLCNALTHARRPEGANTQNPRKHKCWAGTETPTSREKRPGRCHSSSSGTPVALFPLLCQHRSTAYARVPKATWELGLERPGGTNPTRTSPLVKFRDSGRPLPSSVPASVHCICKSALGNVGARAREARSRNPDGVTTREVLGLRSSSLFYALQECPWQRGS